MTAQRRATGITTVFLLLLAAACASLRGTVEDRRIRVLLDEISKGAQRQSHGLNDIGGSVKQLDDSVQQNAALSEETAAPASSLSDQANLLVDKVARFKLPDVVS